MILKKLKLKIKKENKKRILNKKMDNNKNLKVQLILKMKNKYFMMIFQSLQVQMNFKIIKMIIKLFKQKKR